MHSYTQKHLILRILELVVAILVVNWIAVVFHLYYVVWWFDIPMHFIGGVFIGLLYTYISLRFNSNTFSIRYLFRGIVFILVIGLLWEVFEFSLDTFITFKSQNIIDSLSDICFDLAGGLFVLWYGKRYLIHPPKDSS